MGLIPGWGAKIPYASRPENQNIKQGQYCNKFNKDFLKNHGKEYEYIYVEDCIILYSRN